MSSRNRRADGMLSASRRASSLSSFLLLRFFAIVFFERLADLPSLDDEIGPARQAGLARLSLVVAPDLERKMAGRDESAGG